MVHPKIVIVLGRMHQGASRHEEGSLTFGTHSAKEAEVTRATGARRDLRLSQLGKVARLMRSTASAVFS